MSRYPIALAVHVDAPGARALVALTRDGLRRAQLEGWRLDPEVRDLLRSLEQLASVAKTDPTTRTESTTGTTMTTDEAAALLGISTRQVLNLRESGTIRGRRVAGQWALDASDVHAELAARRKVRKSSEVIGNADDDELE